MRIGNRDAVKKTLLLSTHAATALEDMAAAAGTDQNRIVEYALFDGWGGMRDMLCFACEAGEHPLAYILDNYQARQRQMTPERTERLCDMVLDAMDNGMVRFFTPVGDLDGLNSYVAGKIRDAACEVEGAPFGELRDLAAGGGFIAFNSDETCRNVRAFVTAVRNFAHVPGIGTDDLLIRVIVVALRDAGMPVKDAGMRRAQYAFAKRFGVDLM